MKEQKAVYWPYIISAYLGLFALGFLDNFRSPYLLDVTRDLGLSHSEGALFYIIPAFFAYLGSQWANFNIQRIAPVWGVRAGLVGLSLGIFSFARMESLWGMILPSLIFGAGLGFLGVFEHGCVFQGTSKATRRRFLAGLHSIYAGSALCAPLLAKYIFENFDWDWRSAFSRVAIIPLVFLVVLIFVKKKPAMNAEKKQEALRAPKSYFWAFNFLAMMAAFYVNAEISISTRLALYLRRAYGFSLGESSQYLVYFFLLLLLGRLFFTFFPFKKMSVEKLLVYCLSLSFVSYFAGLWWHPLGLVACGLFMSPCFAFLMEYITEVFEAYAEHAMGYAMSMATIMTLPMHFVVGFLTDHWGLKVALHIGPFFLGLSLLMLILRKKFI